MLAIKAWHCFMQNTLYKPAILKKKNYILLVNLFTFSGVKFQPILEECPIETNKMKVAKTLNRYYTDAHL